MTHYFIPDQAIWPKLEIHVSEKKFPISKKRFGQFVAASHGASFRRGDSDRCPLTRAVQAIRPKAKGKGPYSSPGGRVTHEDYKLPPWAFEFMELYDDGASAVAAARKIGAIK